MRTYILQNQKPKHRFSAPFVAVSLISLFLEDFCLDNNNSNNNNNNSNNNININTSVQKLLLDAVERNADVNMGWLARGKVVWNLSCKWTMRGSVVLFSFLFFSVSEYPIVSIFTQPLVSWVYLNAFCRSYCFLKYHFCLLSSFLFYLTCLRLNCSVGWLCCWQRRLLPLPIS